MPTNESTTQKGLDNLTKSLAFIHDPYLEKLSEILLYSLPKGIFHLSAREKDNVHIQETIILGWEWKLLIPSQGGSKTLAWEDAFPCFDTSTIYRLPNIAVWLVKEAVASGQWLPVPAVKALCPVLYRLEEWQIVNFMAKISRLSFGGRVNVLQLKRIGKSMRLDPDPDQLISQFKSAGILSPVLSPISRTMKYRSPLYEINPSVFSTSLKWSS